MLILAKVAGNLRHQASAGIMLQEPTAAAAIGDTAENPPFNAHLQAQAQGAVHKN